MCSVSNQTVNDMPDPKTRILKVNLPAELYDALEKAAADDDRELDRYVVRMVKQYLSAPGHPAYSERPLLVGPVGYPGPTIPAGAVPQPPAPVGRAIPLVIKPGSADGIPIDLMSDNALNGEPEELVNPNVSPVVVPKPNPNAPDMFGPSHRK